MFQLYLCIVVFSVLSHAINPDDLAELTMQKRQLSEVCAEETGAGQSDLQEVVEKLPLTTRGAKCIMLCVHKKINFQDASGKINPAAIYDWADSLAVFDADYAKKAKEVLGNCVDSSNDSKDDCDVASELYMCFCKGFKEVGLDVP